MIDSRRWKISAASVGLLVVLAGLGLAATAQSAKNANKLVVDLQGTPGPIEVTVGQNVASTLTVENPSVNPWKKVIVNMPAPATSPTQKATLKYVAGPGQLVSGVVGTSNDVQINLDTLEPNEKNTLFFVWQTPFGGSDCTPNVQACIDETVLITGFEQTVAPDAKPSSREDTFTDNVVFNLLGTPDTLEAGGYPLTTCTSPGKTLETNANVGPGNPFASATCIPNVPGLQFAPGVVVEIDEDNDADTGTDIPFEATFCVPAPGEKCSDPGYTPWPFSPDATMSFVFDSKSLPKKIELVLHHGEDVTSQCTIDNGPKLTFVGCPAPFNGDWKWG